VAPAPQKLKKGKDGPPSLALSENPDILARVAGMTAGRPQIVVGFAAETADVIAHAKAKLVRKGCDMLIANDVSADSGITGGVMGGDANGVHLVTASGTESWPVLPKVEVAARLMTRLADMIKTS
jgi:phosphopantothenoylcysteine decarboxylase / phosphopantothenate---cysteine ligase